MSKMNKKKKDNNIVSSLYNEPKKKEEELNNQTNLTNTNLEGNNITNEPIPIEYKSDH